jgi:Tol biopolymer transport system component
MLPVISFRLRKTWLVLLTISFVAVPALASACKSSEAPGTEIVFLHRREVSTGRISEGGEEFQTFDEIYVVNVDGWGFKRLLKASSGSPAMYPTWSPDGRRIAVMGTEGIYVMKADGTGLSQIAPSSLYDPPAWSPDGTRLAVISIGGTPFSEVVIVNVDGSEQISLASDTGWGPSGSPSWSPDGQRLAYTATLGDPGAGFDKHDPAEAKKAVLQRPTGSALYVISVDGTGETKLGEHESVFPSPVWSPDGRHIAFVVAAGDNAFAWAGPGDRSFDLYLINAEGSGETRLAHLGPNPTPIAWSPDGTRIAFALCSSPDRGSLNIVHTDGSGRIDEVEIAGCPQEGQIDWAPDSGRIAFIQQRVEEVPCGPNAPAGVPRCLVSGGPGLWGDIYIANTNGSGVSRVTKDGNALCCLNWSPAVR